MPQFSPIVVDTQTYTPVANANNKAMFTDQSEDLVANWPKLSVSVTQVTVAATGKTEIYLTIPVPVVEGNCCVDTNQPSVISARVVFQRPIQASKAQVSAAITQLQDLLDVASIEAALGGEAFY